MEKMKTDFGGFNKVEFMKKLQSKILNEIIPRMPREE
jgi:hypothetical protein